MLYGTPKTPSAAFLRKQRFSIPTIRSTISPCFQTVPFCYYHMYRTLRYSECLSRLPHRGIAVDDIVSDADGTLLNIILQKNTPQESFLQCMKDSRGV